MQVNEQDVNIELQRLRNLISMKNKTEDELRDRAITTIKERQASTEMDALFTDKKEAKVANDLLGRYLEDYAIESVSDRNTLREIIYLEVVQRRLQEKLNAYYAKDDQAIPIQLVKAIHENSEAILRLKESLGLNRSKEAKNKYDVLESLKKRFKKWRDENQASRTAVCPHCTKPIMFKIRTEAWELQQHPFFKDKIIANDHLIRMYKEQRITKEDVGKVLEVSSDYVDWVINKLRL